MIDDKQHSPRHSLDAEWSRKKKKVIWKDNKRASFQFLDFPSTPPPPTATTSNLAYLVSSNGVHICQPQKPNHPALRPGVWAHVIKPRSRIGKTTRQLDQRNLKIDQDTCFLRCSELSLPKPWNNWLRSRQIFNYNFKPQHTQSTELKVRINRFDGLLCFQASHRISLIIVYFCFDRQSRANRNERKKERRPIVLSLVRSYFGSFLMP